MLGDAGRAPSAGLAAVTSPDAENGATSPNLCATGRCGRASEAVVESVGTACEEDTTAGSDAPFTTGAVCAPGAASPRSTGAGGAPPFALRVAIAVAGRGSASASIECPAFTARVSPTGIESAFVDTAFRGLGPGLTRGDGLPWLNSARESGRFWAS